MLCSLYKGAKEQLGDLPIYFQPNSILSITKGFKSIINSIYKKKYNFVKFARSKSTENYIDKVLNVIYLN